MKKLLAILFQLLVISLYAQDAYNLTSIDLRDLAAFRSPASTWQIVGGVYGTPDLSRPSVDEGRGVLYNNFDPRQLYKSESNLFTRLEHGDIYLSLDLLMPKGSNAGIYFQGRYEIQLFDSWGVKKMKSSDIGSIYERWDESRPDGKKGFEGHAARINASFAPNLWQHLEVEFQAPRFDQYGKRIRPAKFVKVALNGVIIHENVLLYGPTRASAFNDEIAVGPLMFQGDHGPVAFRNIRYALLNDFSFKLENLSYQYYEGKFNNDFKEVEKQKPVRSGQADAIDFKLADNPNNMAISFSGSFTIPEDGEYLFTLQKRGNAQLMIDGTPVIPPGTDWFADITAAKHLTQGAHSLTVAYVKNFSWASGGLGLFVGTRNTRPIPLHASTSMPKFAPPPLISVAAEREPELVRSFLMHEDKKLTHTISVGSPAGINYSFDLNQGSLLRVWRGGFLNVTDMWYERGEPQISTPLGAAVSLPRLSPLIVSNTGAPDTLDDRKTLIFKGYQLNEQRLPVFNYLLDGVKIESLLTGYESGTGLVHHLKWESGKQRYTARLAKGMDIRSVSDNLYCIDGRYYIQVLSAGKSKVEIRDTDGKKMLVVSLDSNVNEYRYRVIW